MDHYHLTYFEAYLHVRDRRYVAAPNPGFVDQLCKWHNDKQKGIGKLPLYFIALYFIASVSKYFNLQRRMLE